MMTILVFANFGGTWSVLRITLLVIGVTGVIGVLYAESSRF